MDASKLTGLRTFCTDGGWYDAYWLRQAEAAGGVPRAIADMAGRFRTWSATRLCGAGAFSAWLSFD